MRHCVEVAVIDVKLLKRLAAPNIRRKGLQGISTNIKNLEILELPDHERDSTELVVDKPAGNEISSSSSSSWSCFFLLKWLNVTKGCGIEDGLS